MTSLESLRKEIDAIDDLIIGLIDDRLDIAKEIGSIKKKQDLPIFNSEREKEILDNVANKSKHSQEMKAIFQKIMEESRSVQEKN